MFASVFRHTTYHPVKISAGLAAAIRQCAHSVTHYLQLILVKKLLFFPVYKDFNN